ncbi:serine phosphatase RsbU (regulator of sigma subunit) [Streptomyces sp. 846.5]|nr:GAF domain-containing SpoIIE family protein phosphatase [Streptomyces sp. 846.5]TDT97921.1 serine phosphatase RsbU (regulator of sigma subunit) [Streptomyces sp. 846.5]
MGGEQQDPASADDYDVDSVIQHALDRLTILANVNEALASTFEVEEALRRLAHILVPALGDWCAVDLFDEQGQLQRTVVEHRDTQDLVAFEKVLPPFADRSPALVAQALRSRTPLLSTDFPRPDPGADALARMEQDLFTRLGARSAVACALRSRGRALGVLSVVRSEHGAALDQDDLPLVHDLAHRAALAVDNARLHAQVQQTSERMQRSLLPELPTSGALELGACYRPARAGAEVGGDWYDAFMLPEGATALVIGDVAGHDLSAAVRMSQARNMLRGIACDRKEPPGKILARLDAANDILYRGETMTCVYALVEKLSGDQWWTLHYAVAGHLPPLLITADGRTSFLEEGRSLLLGVDPTRTRPDAFTPLPPQSVVLLYTDGLIERRGEDLDRGLARLRRSAAPLAREPLEDLCEELLRVLAPDSTDDVALIAVRTPALHEGPATALAE